MRPASIFAALSTASIVVAASTPPDSPQSDDFKSEMIAAHNFFRSQHSANALSWNNDLASKAQNWANTCNFSHNSAGENLVSMTSFSSWGSFVNLWGSERTDYNWTHPGFSPTTGHFTQVVWKDTESVGCGWTKCSGGQAKAHGFYVVCKYDPAGNFSGRFAQNVGKQTEGKPTDEWHE